MWQTVERCWWFVILILQLVVAIILEQCANFLLQVHYRGLQTFWKAQLGTPLPFCAQNVTLVEIMCEFYGLRWIWVRRPQAGIVKADGVIKLSPSFLFAFFVVETLWLYANGEPSVETTIEDIYICTCPQNTKAGREKSQNTKVGKIKISKYQRG